MIARARKRPRDKSISFRTFWWLLTREAVLRITDNVFPHVESSGRRAWFARSRTDYVRKFGERLIAQDPARRYWP